MTVVINGTTGITNVDGSAAAPAATGIDTDTGVYYGTNTVGLATNGTNALFVDASQNVGIGTNLPTNRLSAVNTSITGGAPLTSGSSADPNAIARFQIGAVAVDLGAYVSGTVWLQPRLASDYSSNFSIALQPNGGNVGIGTSSPGTKLHVAGGTSQVSGSNGVISFINGNTAGGMKIGAYTAAGNANGYLAFEGYSIEYGRFDSSGNLLVGATSTTWNGAIVKSAGTISLASGASINLSSSLCGGAIVSIYVTGSGNGGLFYLNYSATSVKLAGDGDTTDTGSNFAVYKNAASHVSTLKNKAGSTQTFSVVVVAGQLT